MGIPLVHRIVVRIEQVMEHASLTRMYAGLQEEKLSLELFDDSVPEKGRSNVQLCVRLSKQMFVHSGPRLSSAVTREEIQVHHRELAVRTSSLMVNEEELSSGEDICRWSCRFGLSGRVPVSLCTKSAVFFHFFTLLAEENLAVQIFNLVLVRFTIFSICVCAPSRVNAMAKNPAKNA